MGHEQIHSLGDTDHHTSATTAELNALISDGELATSATMANKVVYVAKNGNDANSGSLSDPFLTIAAANAAITDASSVNPYSIMVFPGVYTETAITMKQYVDIRSMAGPFTTTVVASAVGNTMFTSTGFNTLAGLGLTGATSGRGYYVNSAGISGIIKDCVIYNCAQAVECSAGSAIAINMTTAPVGTITNFFYANGGMIRGQGLVIPATATVGTIFNSTGVGGYIDYVSIESDSANVTTGLRADAGGKIRTRAGEIEKAVSGAWATGAASSIQVQAMKFDECTYGLRANDTARIDALACIIDGSVTYDLFVEALTAVVHMTGCTMDRSKVDYPNGYADIIAQFLDDFDGDEGIVNWGEQAIGRPEKGSELIAGEGDSYIKNMMVLTTDSTATGTTDGGNITDVSVNARSKTVGTFTLQGTAANHTILIGSDNQTATDFLKHWGLKVSQTTAAVEVTPKSFVFEYWNGAAWVAHSVMATGSGNFNRYANEVFIRANSSEHIRYGLDESVTGTDWAKKTISGMNLYWSRIRVVNALTTAPVFNQFKLHSSRWEANEDGTNTFHGRSRFRKSITAAGNVFGESGGVNAWNIAVGSGGLPTGWTHQFKNTLLNGSGDALYYQTSIPRGVDTSLPVYVEVATFNTTDTGTGLGIDFILSVKPAEMVGVLEADPAGGIDPVERTGANTALVTDAVAQTSLLTLDDTTIGKPVKLNFGPFDVSDYYEGDLLFIRLELDNDGVSLSDMGTIEMALNGVNWTHGEKL